MRWRWPTKPLPIWLAVFWAAMQEGSSTILVRFSVYFVLQPERPFRTAGAHCRLWRHISAWYGHLLHCELPGNQKPRHASFHSLFEPTPILFPINLIGELANPLSISLRLFANLLSGVIIMGLWYGMMPIFANIGIPAALHVYCDLFSGCIQTYVFCMLTMVYINDKME